MEVRDIEKQKISKNEYMKQWRDKRKKMVNTTTLLIKYLKKDRDNKIIIDLDKFETEKTKFEMEKAKFEMEKEKFEMEKAKFEKELEKSKKIVENMLNSFKEIT
jgi:hypothetical protein